MGDLWYCPLWRYYHLQPCSIRRSIYESGHEDVWMGDLMDLDDVDSRDMGGDLYQARWATGWRPPLPSGLSRESNPASSERPTDG